MHVESWLFFFWVRYILWHAILGQWLKLLLWPTPSYIVILVMVLPASGITYHMSGSWWGGLPHYCINCTLLILVLDIVRAVSGMGYLISAYHGSQFGCCGFMLIILVIRVAIYFNFISNLVRLYIRTPFYVHEFFKYCLWSLLHRDSNLAFINFKI